MQVINDLSQYEFFHDWYLLGVMANKFDGTVELDLMADNRRDRARVRFVGATRCLLSDFLIQNIVFVAKAYTDFDSEEYRSARVMLNDSYPWGKDSQPKPILSISATMGAEMLIEFDSMEVIRTNP